MERPHRHVPANTSFLSYSSPARLLNNMKRSSELGAFTADPRSQSSPLILGFSSSAPDENQPDSPLHTTHHRHASSHSSAGAEDSSGDIPMAIQEGSNKSVVMSITQASTVVMGGQAQDASINNNNNNSSTAADNIVSVPESGTIKSDLKTQQQLLNVPSQTLPKTPVEQNIAILLNVFNSSIQTPETLSPYQQLVRSSHVVTKPTQFYDSNSGVYIPFDYSETITRIQSQFYGSDSQNFDFLESLLKASVEFALMYQRSLLSPTIGSIISLATKGTLSIDSATPLVWNPNFFYPIYSICLPQNETNLAERHRILEITQIQYNFTARTKFGGYFGKPLVGGPPMFNHVPPAKDLLLMSDSQTLQTALGYTVHFIKTAEMSKVKTTVSGIFSKEEYKSIDDYAKALRPFFHDGHVTIPIVQRNQDEAGKFNKHWLTDEEYCRQRLQGMNPEKLERIKKGEWAQYKKDLNWTQEVDQRTKTICGGKSIEEAVDAHLIYVVDFRIFADEELRVMAKCNNRHIAAPIALFYLDGTSLKPIGIQLYPENQPDEKNRRYPFWMPKKVKQDSQEDHPAWILAKLWVNSMDGQYQEIIPHLMESHQVPEILAVSMFRNLGVNHPIHKLLRPHFEATIEVNGVAYADLLSKDGAISNIIGAGAIGAARLIGKTWYRYSFYKSSFKQSLIRRGFLEEDGQTVSDTIDRYCWRTYGLDLWTAIYNFVKSVLEQYYKTEADIEEDWELQFWIEEIQHPHYGNMKEPTENGKLERRDQLYTFITDIIFTVTGKHSSGNSGQFDYYGFVPNVPAGMYIEPRIDDKLTTWDTIMEALPNKEAALAQMSITYLLSQVNGESLPTLGYAQYPDEWKIQVATFQKTLGDLSDKIYEIESSQNHPYTYLDPRRVANSVYI